MPENNKDNLDEILAINNKLRQTSEELEDISKEVRELEKIEHSFYAINQEQNFLLDELSSGWTGDEANQALQEAYEEKEREFRNIRLFFDNRKSELHKVKNQLVSSEDELLEKRLTLKKANL